MLRLGLQYGARRLLTTAATRQKKADLVCPICFDFGFTQTAFRGSIEDDASGTDNSRPPSPKNEQYERENDKMTPASCKALASEVAEGSSSGSKMRSSASLLAQSEIMKHKYEGKIETIYTMPIDNETVETRVYDLLDGQKPNIEEGGHDEAQAFVKAELIKNQSIPFKYWLEQPCPSHRDTKGQIAPCVTFRRGLHDYMMEFSSGYADRQALMLDLGFVTTGGSSASQCLRIGHMGAGDIPAHAWAIESFLKDGMDRENWNSPALHS